MRLRRLGGVAGLAVLVVMFSAPVGLVQAAFFWHTEIAADNATGFNVSMALDSAGQPHISYQDFANQTLNYAHHNGTSWVIEVVDSGGHVGAHSSIALDDQDRPHISYAGNTDTRLKYAYYTGTDWQIEVVDEVTVSIGTSLALDSSGRPHIAYTHLIGANQSNLKYAYHDGADWVTTTLDNSIDTGWYASLALDGDDQPHISYWDRGGWLLKYTHYANGSWTTETVDGDGSTFLGTDGQMVLDSAGWPHISYVGANDSLKYAHRDGGGWHLQAVDVNSRTEGTAIALDNAANPHISYHDGAAIALKYAYFDGTDWQFMVVDGAVDVGWLPALVLDADELAHIAYIDADIDDVKYAYLTVNAPPTVEAGGPYSGVEGSPISLAPTVTDLEDDELTTVWSYTIDSADPGTTCAFDDASQVEATFTCDDDGTFTLTLTADDGINPEVTDSASVTIRNAPPIITDSSATMSGTRVTVTVDATDPGENDVLSYAFDCNNDGAYEVGPQADNSAMCTFVDHIEGTFQIGVQVSDDDGGVITDSVSVSIPTAMCANDYTGVLRYTSTCQSHETTITIPGEGPVTICASKHNGLLRLPTTGSCAGHEISYLLPDDGPLNVCINRHTQVMRAVNDIAQCTSHEFGRVIAATEIGELPPPRSR